ncbi:CCR4-NOT transcription complex subunit 8 [Thelohanellus kitauei]|uniref:poly(A)-specific ribonuclease n=1 Tax=Thelohanellus kitauei TaxID=669202 RepID=A0A0C2J0Z7_THEKT|nr:CCR4-NOT transcription complex subunit 8 [Thelohanellus kitauei]
MSFSILLFRYLLFYDMTYNRSVPGNQFYIGPSDFNHSSLRFQVVDVWAENLYEEFFKMVKAVDNFKIVAMDTEYPGNVVTVPSNNKDRNYYTYTNVAANVNLMKLIQLGFSFFDENGDQPQQATTWQFNLKFSLISDMSSDTSINMLMEHGFVFDQYAEHGIDHNVFTELLYYSGLLMNPEIRWITFHGIPDFCYLIKMLINTHLPHQEDSFTPLLNTFFPRVYDLKYMMRDCRNINGGLETICSQLQIYRRGGMHHAGSDSFMTGVVFFVMHERFFEDQINEEKYCGRLFSCENQYPLEYLKNHYGCADPPKVFHLRTNKKVISTT